MLSLILHDTTRMIMVRSIFVTFLEVSIRASKEKRHGFTPFLQPSTDSDNPNKPTAPVQVDPPSMTACNYGVTNNLSGAGY